MADCHAAESGRRCCAACADGSVVSDPNCSGDESSLMTSDVGETSRGNCYSVKLSWAGYSCRTVQRAEGGTLADNQWQGAQLPHKRVTTASGVATDSLRPWGLASMPPV